MLIESRESRDQLQILHYLYFLYYCLIFLHKQNVSQHCFSNIYFRCLAVELLWGRTWKMIHSEDNECRFYTWSWVHFVFQSVRVVIFSVCHEPFQFHCSLCFICQSDVEMKVSFDGNSNMISTWQVFSVASMTMQSVCLYCHSKSSSVFFCKLFANLAKKEMLILQKQRNIDLLQVLQSVS